SSNCVVATLSCETGYTLGVGHTHGRFGAMMKFAGYDGVVFQGVSPKPVFLWISDGRAELRDASAIWGKDTHETEDLVKADVGEAEASVSAIGPGGEAMMAGGAVETDKYHMAAKGGSGSVLGSKRLKAVAAYGNWGVRASDPAKLIEVAEDWRRKMFQGAMATAPSLFGAGTSRSRDRSASRGHLAIKNFSDPAAALEFAVRYKEASKRSQVRPQGCFSCPIACSYRIEVGTGPHAGYVATLSGGGEGLEGAAVMAGVIEPGAVWRLADRYDRLGLDSGVVGSAIALCFECYERGLLSKEQTGGLELNWGNAEAAEALLGMAMRREGLGKSIAEGPLKTAQTIGGDALNYVVHVKGTSINLHDFRMAFGVLLGQFVSTIGPAWQAFCLDGSAVEPDLGFETLSDAFDPTIKPREARLTAIKKCFDDSLGTCWFNDVGFHGYMDLAGRALGHAVGWGAVPRDEMEVIGERVLNLTRAFSIKHGYKPVYDLDISPRILEAPPSGPAKGHSVAPFVKDMILEYYRLMDWDAEIGRPSEAKLRSLGLDEIVSDLYGNQRAGDREVER
ncbi:MAG: aldehyde ferredoxin oxidoreductase C-terminal domain-containing protein, partial [Dehalococcoidia bacterium]|nr:aldehyde ferredoxin oxidoreductase C-terminal domain-containing protein [Dehalococcoidia bacterium]